MAELDTISVIIPVYKVEKYLNRCIRSVVNQSYRNLEIILVDDGSPDQCGKICDEWAEEDKRIRVIHKQNGGLSDARNAGLDIATGEYIGFVDSDDYIHPEMYQRMYEKAKESNVDLTMCNFCLVDESDNSDIIIENMCGDGEIDKRIALKNIYKYNSYEVVWNKLYKWHLFENLRFPKGKIEEDVFIMPHIFDSCTKICCVSEVYYYYLQTPDSITRGKKTIRNLDGVEAYYRFLLYCEEKGYSELLQGIAYKMADYYMWVKTQIPYVLPDEKKRLHEIKRMLRYGYLKYGGGIRPLQILYVECPAVYRAIWRIKRKLLKRPG